MALIKEKEIAETDRPKRVGCLYRVSTKGQVDGDDIPMQKRSCRNFIDKQGWVLVKEYVELGVSGFKVSANKRDAIQRAKEDAEQGLYDILLVFMFDRLGRKDDETPFVMKWFSKQGIELWSVKEGQQKFEDHSDDLINYIRFWQSSGESKKTSMRVDENHMQMVEDGIFRGGKPPYGYRLVKSGQVNKKQKELLTLEIDESQAEIVREIFMLVYEQGYGSNRIAKYLNTEREPRVPSSTGGDWTTGVINFMLRNPIYKGYLSYGKRKSDTGVFAMQDRDKWVVSKKQNPNWVIISEDIWDAVQEMRSRKSPQSVKDEDTVRRNVTNSPLLFVGVAKCGYCGSPLTTTYNAKTYKLADGTKKKWKAPKYRCSGKALGKPCEGQTIYAQSKVEGVVLEEIELYLNKLEKVDFEKQLTAYKRNNMDADQKRLKNLQLKLETCYKELTVLNNEVPKALMGQSSFSADLLSSLIKQKDEEIKNTDLQIAELELELRSKKSNANDIELLQKYVPVWKDVFVNASHDKQKMMLRAIIDTVRVFRDKVEIDVKLHISHFIGTVDGSIIDLQGRALRWQ